MHLELPPPSPPSGVEMSSPAKAVTVFEPLLPRDASTASAASSASLSVAAEGKAAAGGPSLHAAEPAPDAPRTALATQRSMRTQPAPPA
jgi:hypothetical protein